MAMQALRNGASKGFTKFILFGFLILAVGGLVMTDVGGFFRGGISQADIGRVGDEKIHINNFDSIVRRTLPRLGLAREEAYKLGYINQLLAAEMRSLLLNQSASDIGLNVGRKHLANEVRKIVEPMVTQGQDAQGVLEQILLNQGMSEQDFVANMKREVENDLLSSAINSGFAFASPDMAKDMYKYQYEERDVNILVYLNKNFKDVKEPTDLQISGLYQSLKETFAVPETRKVSLLKIKNETLENTIDITDEEILEAYEDDIESYTIPSQRTLEQAILSTKAQADDVASRLAKGTALKKATNDVTQSDTSYLGETDFEEDGLLEEIASLAFSAAINDVIGPVETPLGWHVMILKSIKAQNVMPFEKAKKELKEELLHLKLAESLYEMANIADDIFAGGGSVEDVAQEVEMDIITLPPFNNLGLGKDGKDALKDHGKLREVIIEAAFEYLQDEASPVMEMADGSFVAVYINSITDKSYRPLEDVRKELIEKWNNDQRALSNKFATLAHLAKLEANGMSLKNYAQKEGKTLKSIKNINRQSSDKAPLGVNAIRQIYTIPVGGLDIIEVDGGSAIVEIVSSSFPSDADTSKEIDTFQTNLVRTSQEEGLQSYVLDMNDRYGTVINHKLLKQVYGSSAQ